ncbi:DUF3313 domain-containing protein [Erwinia psidii]|uniref:DUF3313 domain-containing protein n=1 Tax=Erwinia psidii TaxID=69224 RepID=UPI00226B7CCA|nr:DUF3313 domain-containing protein [Erwinia psidii]MCX8966030.1 DUF3313 domain-containing protein [Erwinia psidii]
MITMSKMPAFYRSLMLMTAVTMAGCAGTQPVPYSNLQASSRMQPNTGDDAYRVPYRYTTNPNWQQYHQAILEPVAVYSGADNQFGKMDAGDQQELATYMQQQFGDRLKQRFSMVNTPAPGTLRIKLTLTGADTTTPVAGTFTKFDLAGGPYNIVQSIRGREGMMNGWVSYATEIYDAQTNQLLAAWVEKQYPNAMNVSASIGSLSAAKVGVEKGADDLIDRLK